MKGAKTMEGKFYTKLWFIMCMSILMPPFGLALCLGFKNPRNIKFRIFWIVITLANWGAWLYAANVLKIM